jgi:hypothetical protein
MNEAEMRQLYVALQPGDFVEIVHHVTIGFKEYATHTVGVVVKRSVADLEWIVDSHAIGTTSTGSII